jgi:ubiquinone/menaquinone biosynthesis C-methylase UbiE
MVQLAVGATYIRRRFARQIAPYRSANFVLDIGGGTGAARDPWCEETRYVCLDIDPEKLEGFRAKFPNESALQADATNLPISDKTLDAVVCTFVTHHLTDDMLQTMLAESARVLKPSGRLILMDAVLARYRMTGRLLWRYDRGSFPRPKTRLFEAIERSFEIVSRDEFAVLHRYIIAVGKPKVDQRSGV